MWFLQLCYSLVRWTKTTFKNTHWRKTIWMWGVWFQICESRWCERSIWKPRLVRRDSQVQVSLERYLMKIHQVFFSTHVVWNNATKRGYATIDNLLQMHIGEISFKCETCGKRFLRWKRLKSHEQIGQNKQSLRGVLSKSYSEKYAANFPGEHPCRNVI